MSDKLVISNELFVDFIKKSTLEGEIQQLLLEQTDLGYEISVMSESVISCIGVLLKKNFISYGKIGNITIKDVKKFINIIKDWKGNVTIEKKENKVILYSEKNEFEYVLCSEEFIETTLKDKIEIEFDDGFKISKEFFEALTTKSNLFGVGKIKIQVKNNIIRGIIEETDKYIIKEEIPYKDCESEYGLWLLKLGKFLGDKVNVSFDTNYPIKITSKNTNFELSYYIAPFVKTEAEVEEKKEEKEEKKEDEKES